MKRFFANIYNKNPFIKAKIKNATYDILCSQFILLLKLFLLCVHG